MGKDPKKDEQAGQEHTAPEKKGISPDTWVILGLFTITLAVRMIFAFQTPYLTGDDSYFWARQAESILATGKHFTHDTLGWMGRDLSFPPIFAYVIAAAGLFGQLAISGKILLNTIAATTTIFVYLIGMHLTGSRHVAALAGVVSIMTPVFLAETTTSLTPYSMIIPLYALMVYAYLRIESRAWTLTYLAALAILSFLSPLAIVFIIGLFAYALLAKIEGINLRREEPEVIMFGAFFIIWAALVQYKRAILSHGPGFIWQNIPDQILNSYFTDVNILSIITNIGLVPFTAGVFVTYTYLLRKQSLNATMLIGQALAIGTLLWLKLVKPQSGYLLFGLVLCLLFAFGYQSFLSWLSQTRFGATHRFTPLAIFLIIVITSLLPSIAMTAGAISESKIDAHMPALEWLGKHTSPSATVLADPDEGYMINDIASRQTMIDSNFVLAPDSEERYEDLSTLTSTPIRATAVGILAKYDIQYIYMSPRFLKRFTDESKWIADADCFTPLYNKTIVIYQVICQLQKV